MAKVTTIFVNPEFPNKFLVFYDSKVNKVCGCIVVSISSFSW